MPELTVGWEYLTGYSVAAVKQDGPAEWPPHPGRVFLAMAAAWFETVPGRNASETELRDHKAEGEALRWLEALGDPELWLPPSGPTCERSQVTVAVPPNDKIEIYWKKDGKYRFAGSRQDGTLARRSTTRMFHCRYLGSSPCFLRWKNVQCVEEHREALARICAKVTRVGHSSSLVCMWVEDHFEPDQRVECWRVDAAATAHCRVMSAGMLDALPVQTQIPRIEAFAELVWAIQDAEREVDEAKSSGDAAAKRLANQTLKQSKAEYQQRFGEEYRKSATAPAFLRPRLGLWSGYRRVDAKDEAADTPLTHFDADLLVLTQVDGPRLPVTTTLMVTQALRGAVMHHSGIQPVPAWVSGHQPDGSLCDEEAGHLALVPLPFVGREHADGHLLGAGLVFPRNVDRPERGRVLGPLLLEESGRPRTIELRLGPLGVWALCKRDWSETRQTLRAETWTAHPRGASLWASVTPVVLDKFPKADRSDPGQRGAWEAEVRTIIAAACARIGLPKPIHIDIDTTSWHVGSPRAVCKRRPLREAHKPELVNGAALGDGFPAYAMKGTNAPRPQVHVFLQFDRPVLGPVLIGAGRYRGYGLFKPWEVH